MNTFLSYVAKDILRNYPDMSQVAVVFPNKRASLFLNEELMRQAGHPIWCPTYITISDLFRRHSNLEVADPIQLVCELHKTFVECTQVDETLDHFYGWGQLLIADFDDIDKNMADAHQVFFNVENLHALDDDSYLTEEQRQILKKFFGNFHDGEDTELKRRFMELWNKLGDIYTLFNKRLAEKGLAYEGALYRQVAERQDIEFEHDTYLFVGFNMMQTVERKLYDQLGKKASSHFYWDYDVYYVDDKRNHSLDRKEWNVKNEAGHYISQYLSEYGNKLNDTDIHDSLYDNMSREKSVNYVSAPTENIQARYVYHWLMDKKHKDEQGNWVPRYQAGRKTAIVLANESLLPSVIHSLPEEVKNVNITLGYPLQQTPFFSLVQQLIELQTLGHPKGTATYRLHQVSKVLRHPYANFISEHCAPLMQHLNDKKRFYPSREELCPESDEGLKALFLDLEAAENYNLALTDYLLSILRMMGLHTSENEDPLFQESLYRTYTLINRLRGLIASGDLVVDIITLERLIQQLFQSTTVPFHGEPMQGVQVMGILETRNLDFEHILVLSCNEGNYPKSVSDSSFIPYSVRKANGLTTIDNKVAISAYYFLSMLQRADDITLTYNNATQDGQTGEMSRFMLQLLVESKHDIKRWSLTAGQSPEQPDVEDIAKGDAEMAEINKMKFVTPTCLNTFIRCRKRFYYRYIKHLDQPDELEDEIDNRIFGNIFHKASQLFYLQFASPADLRTNAKGEVELIHPIVIMPGDIDNALKHDSVLYRLVDQAFAEELFKVTENDYKPAYNGLQLINREVIASYLKQLLRIDRDLAPFTLKGLELKVTADFEFDTPDGKKKLSLGGYIDRLDAVSAGGKKGVDGIGECIRVIDYKTGRTPAYFPKTVESLFQSEELSKHSDYYLQAMLYSLIVKNDQQLNKAQEPVRPALLFIQQSGAKDYDPTLKFGKEVIEDAATYKDEFMQGLRQLISDIYDRSIPFSATEDKMRCNSCPYASLCRNM